MKQEEIIYNQIKDRFIDIEVNKKASEYYKNKYDLSKYYEIGKLLIDAQGGEERAKYGDNIIKDYSIRLTNELGKGYSRRNLEYIRRFYLYQKTQSMIAQLSWTHYVVLLSLDNPNAITYYINRCIDNNITVRKLKELIKSKEYERLPDSTRNKLINQEDLAIVDNTKNPLVVRSHGLDIINITEKQLHMAIIYDLKNFLFQLGEGYTYVGDEYPIKIGNDYNYIDILLFNYKYNCFVVVELKVTKLNKSHIGQVQIYMNYIDEHLKQPINDKTIGLIVVKENNEYIIKYSSDKRIKCVEWKLT